MNFFEIVNAIEFKIESKIAPEWHEQNLKQINKKSKSWFFMYRSIINSHEWQ
jgi:hypothetical protein